MITFKFRGNITEIGELKQGTSKSGKDWSRIDFVCEVADGRYSDYIAVTASNEVAHTINSCDIGEEIAVEGYIYAREYNDRYYNNLEVTKVYRHKAQAPNTPIAPVTAPAPAAQEGADDLPF